MRLLTATILTTVLALPFAPGARAEPQHDQIRGSTNGLASSDPTWSMGLQIGNGFGTGVSAQKVGFYDGALNLGLGFDRHSVAAAADYLFVYSKDVDPKPLPPGTTYNQLRGELQPYWGLGASAGKGFALRVPLGVQYTMLRDPFNFFGGFALVAGNLRGKEDDDRFRLWVSLALGARALL